MVKLRTLHWPARVIRATPSVFVVQIFGKDDLMTLKQDDCLAFNPSPESTKNKPKPWREAYSEALKIHEA